MYIYTMKRQKRQKRQKGKKAEIHTSQMFEYTKVET